MVDAKKPLIFPINNHRERWVVTRFFSQTLRRLTRSTYTTSRWSSFNEYLSIKFNWSGNQMKRTVISESLCSRLRKIVSSASSWRPYSNLHRFGRALFSSKICFENGHLRNILQSSNKQNNTNKESINSLTRSTTLFQLSLHKTDFSTVQRMRVENFSDEVSNQFQTSTLFLYICTVSTNGFNRTFWELNREHKSMWRKWNLYCKESRL